MYCSVLYNTLISPISFTLIYCTTHHCTALHCTALHCTALHCTALHCTALHRTVSHYTTLHFLFRNLPVPGANGSLWGVKFLSVTSLSLTPGSLTLWLLALRGPVSPSFVCVQLYSGSQKFGFIRIKDCSQYGWSHGPRAVFCTLTPPLPCDFFERC